VKAEERCNLSHFKDTVGKIYVTLPVLSFFPNRPDQTKPKPEGKKERKRRKKRTLAIAKFTNIKKEKLNEDGWEKQTKKGMIIYV